MAADDGRALARSSWPHGVIDLGGCFWLDPTGGGKKFPSEACSFRTRTSATP
jgi:hypothetical protein